MWPSAISHKIVREAHLGDNLTSKHYKFARFFGTPSLVVGFCLAVCPIGFSKSDKDATLRSQSYYYFLVGTLQSMNGESEEALQSFEQASITDQKSSFIKLKRSEELLNLNRTDEAKTLLDQIRSTEKGNPEYSVLEARVSSQTGNILGSLTQLDTATDLYFAEGNTSKAREIALTKVALQADARDYKGSTQTLEKYLAKRPDDEIAFYFLGKIHSIFHNKIASKKMFQKALELRPGFPAAAKALGLQLELEAKMDEAYRVYLKAFGANASDEELAQKLINISLIRDDYVGALEFINHLLNLRPGDLQSLMRAGLINYKLKSYAAAIEFFEQAEKLEEAPHDRIAFYLGNISLEQRELKKATDQFKSISDNSEYFVEARLQAANILATELKKIGAAFDLLNDAIEKKQDNSDLVLAKGALYEQAGRIESAIDYLKKQKILFPKNEKILFLLGNLQEKVGNWEESVESMKEILSFNSNNPHALNHIGYAYVERNYKLEEAELYLKKAVQLAPQNGFIVDSLGWAYFKMGKHQKAVELLKKANQLAPNQPVILEHLADALQKIGEHQQALEIYNRIMRASSDGSSTTSSFGESQEAHLVKERVREKISTLADIGR